MTVGDLIPLGDRLEKWHDAFASSSGSLRIQVSSHGRMRVRTVGYSGPPTQLEFVESVRMLRAVADAMESAMESM